jgi:hypothetical protein
VRCAAAAGLGASNRRAGGRTCSPYGGGEAARGRQGGGWVRGLWSRLGCNRSPSWPGRPRPPPTPPRPPPHPARPPDRPPARPQHLLDDEQRQQGPGQVDEFAGNARFIKAALCAGFYPAALRAEHSSNKYAQVAGGSMQVTSAGGGGGRAAAGPQQVPWQWPRAQAGSAPAGGKQQAGARRAAAATAPERPQRRRHRPGCALESGRRCGAPLPAWRAALHSHTSAPPLPGRWTVTPARSSCSSASAAACSCTPSRSTSTAGATRAAGWCTPAWCRPARCGGGCRPGAWRLAPDPPWLWPRAAAAAARGCPPDRPGGAGPL